MPIQHQQLLTTLEDIAKTQSDKYFEHPIRRQEIPFTEDGSTIIYKCETDFGKSICNVIAITVLPDSFGFLWQVQKDGKEYAGYAHIDENSKNHNFRFNYYDEFFNGCHSNNIIAALDIYKDFKKALKPVKRMLED